MAVAAKSRLVDLENGTISRDIFVSDSIYQQELESIFSAVLALRRSREPGTQTR